MVGLCSGNGLLLTENSPGEVGIYRGVQKCNFNLFWPSANEQMALPPPWEELCKGLALPFAEGWKGITSAGCAWPVSLNSLGKGTGVLQAGFGTSGGFSFLCNPRACLCSSHSFRQISLPPPRIKKETPIPPWTSFQCMLWKKCQNKDSGCQIWKPKAPVWVNTRQNGTHNSKASCPHEHSLRLLAWPSPALVSATWWENNHKAAPGFWGPQFFSHRSQCGARAFHHC